MQHWNSYWSGTKALNSFAEGEHSQGYVGEVADFWQTNFKTLTQSASILDLATGNGGLAVLAQQFDENFHVFASDAANINPLAIYAPSDPNYQVLNKIHFYGNTPSENLTFERAKFDRVISQFGFEYAETNTALLEVHRVLKADGEFIALVHHQDSFISADCHVGLKVISNFQQAGGLLAQLQDFGDFCQTLSNKSEPSAEQQVHFKQKNANLLQLLKQLQSECSSEQELDWYNLLIKELLPVIIDWRQTDGKRVMKLSENLHSFQLRLQDQTAAAWSKADMERVKSEIESNWSSCDIEALELDTGVLCWVLKARK